jgi:hypothetical protein
MFGDFTLCHRVPTDSGAIQWAPEVTSLKIKCKHRDNEISFNVRSLRSLTVLIGKGKGKIPLGRIKRMDIEEMGVKIQVGFN